MYFNICILFQVNHIAVSETPIKTLAQLNAQIKVRKSKHITFTTKLQTELIQEETQAIEIFLISIYLIVLLPQSAPL